MEATLRLEIVTPDRIVVSKEASYVGVPGIEGEFGVLPHHIPLLSALAIGDLYFRSNEGTEAVSHVFVSGGFVEVSGNVVTVLAESAELASNIDVARARQAKERAERRLTSHDEAVDFDRARLALHRAVSRINVATQI